MAMRCSAGRLSPARLERGGSGAAHADDTGPSTRADGVGAQLVTVEMSACPPPPLAAAVTVLTLAPEAPVAVVGAETGGMVGIPEEVVVETDGGGGGGMGGGIGGGGGRENEEEEGRAEEEAGVEERESPAVAAPSRDREWAKPPLLLFVPTPPMPNPIPIPMPPPLDTSMEFL